MNWCLSPSPPDTCKRQLWYRWMPFSAATLQPSNTHPESSTLSPDSCRPSKRLIPLDLIHARFASSFCPPNRQWWRADRMVNINKEEEAQHKILFFVCLFVFFFARPRGWAKVFSRHPSFFNNYLIDNQEFWSWNLHRNWKKRKHTINNNDNICVCFLCPLLSLSLSHFQILTVLFLSLVSLSFLISVLFVCLFLCTYTLSASGLTNTHTHKQRKYTQLGK